MCLVLLGVCSITAQQGTVPATPAPRVYAEHAPPKMMDSQYGERAGHCSFSVEETLASVKRLETRLDSGKWPARAAPFVPHEPAPLLRRCFQGKSCL